MRGRPPAPRAPRPGGGPRPPSFFPRGWARAAARGAGPSAGAGRTSNSDTDWLWALLLRSFGFYLDNNFPRNIKRSVASNGLISEQDFRDWLDPNVASSCDALTADGRDNGIVGFVEDQLDIGNPFSGQYEVGDVQVKNAPKRAAAHFPLFFPVSGGTAPY